MSFALANISILGKCLQARLSTYLSGPHYLSRSTGISNISYKPRPKILEMFYRVSTNTLAYCARELCGAGPGPNIFCLKFFFRRCFSCHSPSGALQTVYKKRVLVQNKLNLLLKIILFNTWTLLHLFTINKAN